MAEVFIGLYVHDNFIRPYIGDVLVVVVMYCFFRIVILDKVKRLPLYTFLIAVFVEVSQYLQLIKILRLEENKFARVILGSTFDMKDIICYGIGTIFIILYEKLIKYMIKL